MFLVSGFAMISIDVEVLSPDESRTGLDKKAVAHINTGNRWTPADPEGSFAVRHIALTNWIPLQKLGSGGHIGEP